MFDTNNYWTSPFRISFGNQTKVVIDLQNMTAYKDDACTQFDHHVDASHIYIAGFWTTGSAPIYIKDVFLSNDGVNPTGISEHELGGFGDAPHDGVTLSKKEYYTLDGCKLDGPQPGLNIVKVTENNGKTRIFKVCYKI